MFLKYSNSSYFRIAEQRTQSLLAKPSKDALENINNNNQMEATLTKLIWTSADFSTQWLTKWQVIPNPSNYSLNIGRNTSVPFGPLLIACIQCPTWYGRNIKILKWGGRKGDSSSGLDSYSISGARRKKQLCSHGQARGWAPLGPPGNNMSKIELFCTRFRLGSLLVKGKNYCWSAFRKNNFMGWTRGTPAQ